MAELLAGRDRLPRHRQAVRQRDGARQAAGAAARLGKPLIIRSAYRSPEHNRAVGGAKASKHMEGIAFDIAMANHDPEAFEAAARAVGFQGFGFYRRSGFMHIDLGPARSWGERFPKRATAFAAETPPAREVLAESRTLKGGGAAGVATVGAAGVEVAQQVLAETQGAVLPLVPYLGTTDFIAKSPKSQSIIMYRAEAAPPRTPTLFSQYRLRRMWTA